MTLFLTAYSFTACLHKCLTLLYCWFPGRSLEASWRRSHSSSGFSLSQFVLFLHVIPDRLDNDDDDEDDDEIRSLCGALAVVRLLVQTKIALNYYN